MSNPSFSWARSSAPWLLTLAALGVPTSSASVSGICPDGSFFVVQDPAGIPCERSKQVSPSELPPMRPHYLPSPYTWQVWNERNNPNNPYNLIDSARQVRELQEPEAEGAPAGSGWDGASQPSSVASEIGPLDLGLSDDELRDLFLIVELSQQRASASISRRTADGRGVFEVAFAHSAAFQTKLLDAWRSRGGLEGGQVLLFTANSKRPEEFHANFTFVQGHLTYQPDRSSARQLGVLQGRLGALSGGEVVLGYVVVPDSMSLAADMDVYWNDRHATVAFGG